MPGSFLLPIFGKSLEDYCQLLESCKWQLCSSWQSRNGRQTSPASSKYIVLLFFPFWGLVHQGSPSVSPTFSLPFYFFSPDLSPLIPVCYWLSSLLSSFSFCSYRWESICFFLLLLLWSTAVPTCAPFEQRGWARDTVWNVFILQSWYS